MQEKLPSNWVDSLFTRLQVRYGAAWNRMWDGIDISVVKADWAEELGGFACNPDAIKRALDMLPNDWPPNVAQFKALCIGPPGDVCDKPLRLEAPSADPKIVEAVKSVGRNVQTEGPKAWAWRLKARDFAGDRLTKFQRDAWREALKGELADAARTVEMPA